MASHSRFVASAENYIGRLEVLMTRHQLTVERLIKTGASPERIDYAQRFLGELQAELDSAWGIRSEALRRSCYNSN